MIVYPTGGGTGLVGMWKAFGEMGAMGWIGISRPRLVSVRAAGCAPVVKAFESGAEVTESDRVVVFNTGTGLRDRWASPGPGMGPGTSRLPSPA